MLNFNVKKLSAKSPVYGYKAFEVDADGRLFCRGMEYFPGKVNFLENSNQVETCKNGLHFCRQFQNIERFYSIDRDNVVIYPVCALGTVDGIHDIKSCTDTLYIFDSPVEKSVYHFIGEYIRGPLNYISGLKCGAALKKLRLSDFFIETDGYPDYKKVCIFIEKFEPIINIYLKSENRKMDIKNGLISAEDFIKKVNSFISGLNYGIIKDRDIIKYSQHLNNFCPFYTGNLSTWNVLTFYGLKLIGKNTVMQIEKKRIVKPYFDESMLSGDKFKDHKSAEAYVYIDRNNGCVWLVSYTTVIACVNFKGQWIWCSGTYSNTTRKHIGWFGRLFGLSYYDFKEAVEKRLYW